VQDEHIVRGVDVAVDEGLEAESVWVPLTRIVEGRQVRVEGVSEQHVAALARTLDRLPPIVLHRATMQVIDGAHRIHAARRRGQVEIDAVFFDGTSVEALLLAIRLNHRHGLPLTREDRRAAVARIIADAPAWSDRRIAALAGVSPKTVTSVRQRSTAETPHLDARIGLDGRIRPVDPAAGRRRVSEALRRNPYASVRELAAAAGVAPTTAAKIRRRLSHGPGPARPEGAGSPAPVAVGEPAFGPRPHAVRDLPAGRAAVGGGPSEFTEHLGRLRGDPSFRSNDTGRLLLRLIGTHAAGAAAMERAVTAVPEHCRASVATLARLCAGSWLRLAVQAESASREDF